MKNSARPAHFAAGGQRALVAQPPRRLDQGPRIDVEHRLGVGLVAGLRVVAGEQEEVADAERGGAHHLALQGQPVLVAAGDLQDRLDAGAEQERRRGQRRHMGTRAGAVGHVDRVGYASQQCRFCEQLLRVARHRRRQFRGHDELALVEALLQRRGQGGGCLVVHRTLSAYMLYRTTSNRL